MDHNPLPPNATKRLASLIQKTAVTPGSSTTSALSDYDTIAGAFLESLRGVSVFDTLLAGGMKEVPLKTRVAVVSSAVTGSTVAELQIKPISSLAVTGSTIAPLKAAAIIVGSEELFRLTSLAPFRAPRSSGGSAYHKL